MAALSEHPRKNLSSLTDSLYKNVVEEQKKIGGIIEKISNDKYIIHIHDNLRKIVEKEFINKSKNEYIITSSYENGPIIKNTKNFDSVIIRTIENKMKTSETKLNDLLELCRNTYFGMFKKQIPPKKLDELKQNIMSYPKKTNGLNPTFYKQ
jgi:hypothetical protein